MTEPLTITFRKAKQKGACEESYRKMVSHVGTIAKYGRDTPMPIETVLDVCGFYDALWAIEAIGAEKTLMLFACDCAERVLPIYERSYPDDDRPREAIEAGRSYARGEISHAARAAARVAASAAASAAARAAASDAAWAAARAAASDAAENAAERAWQTERLREYLRREAPTPDAALRAALEAVKK